MKQCSKCKKEKPIADFHLEPRSADGLRYSCRDCDLIRNQNYNLKHRAERLAKAKMRRLVNPSVDREYGKRYREKYPWRTMILHARKRAAKFNWKFDLDQHIPEIKSRLEKMRCEMTGIGLKSSLGCGSLGKRYYNTPSLDRIDTSKGYVYSNIRIVCWAMNMAMGTWGEATLREIMMAWIKK